MHQIVFNSVDAFHPYDSNKFNRYNFQYLSPNNRDDRNIVPWNLFRTPSPGKCQKSKNLQKIMKITYVTEEIIPKTLSPHGITNMTDIPDYWERHLHDYGQLFVVHIAKHSPFFSLRWHSQDHGWLSVVRGCGVRCVLCVLFVWCVVVCGGVL